MGSAGNALALAILLGIVAAVGSFSLWSTHNENDRMQAQVDQDRQCVQAGLCHPAQGGDPNAAIAHNQEVIDAKRAQERLALGFLVPAWIGTFAALGTYVARQMNTHLQAVAPSAANTPVTTISRPPGVICSACGKELDDKAKFCSSCGHRLASCRACGAGLDVSDKFCDACGKPTGGAASDQPIFPPYPDE